jgi:lipopolysaccharide export system permease protein
VFGCRRCFGFNKAAQMMILDKYLIRQFVPIFLIALSVFVFVSVLIDLFSNLVRYLNNEVPFAMILRISLFYIPRSISYALPISLLFAAAYTLGDLYARNELTSIFSSGIPFWRFSSSLLVIGMLASIFSFVLDDVVVIPTYRVKNDLTRRALRQHVTESNSDVVIISRNGELIYAVDFFDHIRLILNGVNIIEMNDRKEFVSQIRAVSADWNGSYWVLNNAVIYQFDEYGMLRIRPFEYSTMFDAHPDMFRRSAVNVQDLPAREAGLLVQDLRSAGLPYTHAQANYFQRYSFAVTPLIVMLLSISMGGRFRKNIMLMSLFSSLAVAVVYYVAEMLIMTMAGLNIIPPIIGAWFPVLFFLAVGLMLLRGAKT